MHITIKPIQLSMTWILIRLEPLSQAAESGQSDDYIRDFVAAVGVHGVAHYISNKPVDRDQKIELRDASHGLTLGDGEQVRFVRYDPVHKGVVWAGVIGPKGHHGSGVYLSQDGGVTWQNVNNNLGQYQEIFNIDVSPYDGTVYVTGDHLWRFRISELTGTGNFPTFLEDRDGDELPDSWEQDHFGNLSQVDIDDPDADGISNQQEYRLNIDPNNPDSDSDSLPDGWEVTYFGDLSQGSDMDPDDDGYTNQQEYANSQNGLNRGTNPRAPDALYGTNDQVNVSVGSTIDIAILANDHHLLDKNGGDEIRIERYPAKGALEILDNGKVLYIPEEIGSFHFTYTAANAQGFRTNVTVVFLTVE